MKFIDKNKSLYPAELYPVSDDYVSIESAIKLMGFDFNWPCHAYYDISQGSSQMDAQLVERSSVTAPKEISVPAPTLAQADKWLRNTFGLRVQTVFDGRLWIYGLIDLDILSDNRDKPYHDAFKIATLLVKTGFTSSEAAMCNGIDTALRMLKTITARPRTQKGNQDNPKTSDNADSTDTETDSQPDK